LVESTEFYFAGPTPMVEAMNDLLVTRWRAPLGQIHTDKFFLARAGASIARSEAT